MRTLILPRSSPSLPCPRRPRPRKRSSTSIILGAEVVGELGTQRYDERIDNKFVGTSDVAGLLVGGGIGIRPVFVLPSGLRFSVEVSGTLGPPARRRSRHRLLDGVARRVADRHRLRAAPRPRRGAAHDLARRARRRVDGSRAADSQLFDATSDDDQRGDGVVVAVAHRPAPRPAARRATCSWARPRALRRRHPRLRRPVARARAASPSASGCA